MKHYFAYIRVSTVKQGEHGSSLQEQRSAIETYAARHGLSIAAWFEEKETAAKQGRAVFSRMLAQLERGVAHGIIIHKIDRSARNLRDWAALGSLIDRGIDVHFAHDPVDLRSRGGRLSADIQAVVAADYVRNLREEVIKGLRGRLNQGLYPFAAPIGYLNKGKGQVKEIDPVLGPLVRQAFELYATGTVSLKELRKELLRRGLTSLGTGKPLSLNGVSTILNNPFYIGIIHIKRTGTTYQGKHEPLISKALFDRVQAILKGKYVSRVIKHDFLFRRLVRCAACGYHLIGERHKTRYIYYRCHTDGCERVCIREELLDHAVQTTLVDLEWDESERRWAREIAATMSADGEAEVDRLRRSLTMRVAQCDIRLARLTDAYLDQVLERELFEVRKRDILMHQRELRDRLASLSIADLPVTKALEKLELGNAAYLSYINGIPPEKRAMVETVTSNFAVQGKNPMVALKSPFSEIANWRKSLSGAPDRSTARTRAKQLLDILIALAEKERNGAVGETGVQKRVA
jgi:site-specific DNA recombinase